MCRVGLVTAGLTRFNSPTSQLIEMLLGVGCASRGEQGTWEFSKRIDGSGKRRQFSAHISRMVRSLGPWKARNSLSFSGRDGVVSDTTFVLISPFEMSFPLLFRFTLALFCPKKKLSTRQIGIGLVLPSNQGTWPWAISR